MRWPWTPRRRRAPEPINHLGPVPDGDTILAPGQRRTAELLAEESARRAALDAPTVLLNLPLLTRGQRWRSNGGQDPILPQSRS